MQVIPSVRCCVIHTSEEISDSFDRRTMYIYMFVYTYLPTTGSHFFVPFSRSGHEGEYTTIFELLRFSSNFLHHHTLDQELGQHCEWFSSLFCGIETSFEAHGNSSISISNNNYVHYISPCLNTIRILAALSGTMTKGWTRFMTHIRHSR
jgi:hypothetical protein